MVLIWFDDVYFYSLYSVPWGIYQPYSNIVITMKAKDRIFKLYEPRFQQGVRTWIMRSSCWIWTLKIGQMFLYHRKNKTCCIANISEIVSKPLCHQTSLISSAPITSVRLFDHTAGLHLKLCWSAAEWMTCTKAILERWNLACLTVKRMVNTMVLDLRRNLQYLLHRTNFTTGWHHVTAYTIWHTQASPALSFSCAIKEGRGAITSP